MTPANQHFFIITIFKLALKITLRTQNTVFENIINVEVLNEHFTTLIHFLIAQRVVKRRVH